jgi:hypothetical protein
MGWRRCRSVRRRSRPGLPLAGARFLHPCLQFAEVYPHFLELTTKLTELQVQPFHGRCGWLGLGNPSVALVELPLQPFGHVVQTGGVQMLDCDLHMMHPSLDLFAVLLTEGQSYAGRIRRKLAELTGPGSGHRLRPGGHFLSKTHDLTFEFGGFLLSSGPLMFLEFRHKTLELLDSLASRLGTRIVRALADPGILEFGGALPHLFDGALEAHGLLMPACGFELPDLLLRLGGPLP